VAERQLGEQIQEDIAHYDLSLDGGTLLCFVYDPELLLREPRKLEAAWSKHPGPLRVRCVIA
jgi:hypothetical protein